MRRLFLGITLFSYLLLLWAFIPIFVWQCNVVSSYREGKIQESEMISQLFDIMKDFFIPFEWKLFTTFGALAVLIWIVLKGLAQEYSSRY